MDVQLNCVSLYTLFLISTFTLGICGAQDISLSDLMPDGSMADNVQPRDRRVPYSTFDPEIDWSRQETDNDADNTLVNFMKRDIYPFDSYSGRFPRINRRKIIPFYQYGNEFRGYRTSPRFTSQNRKSYFVSPWKVRGYNFGNRMVRAYDGYNK